MECTSSDSASSSKTCRGCRGLRSMSAGGISRYTAPIGEASCGGGPPIKTSAAASPIRGPRVAGPESPSAGPVGISEARPRPRPPFLRNGCVMVVPSRMWSIALGEFTTRIEVAHRPARTGVVIDDRHGVAGRLGNLDAGRDHRAQHLDAELGADLCCDLVCEFGAAVV